MCSTHLRPPSSSRLQTTCSNTHFQGEWSTLQGSRRPRVGRVCSTWSVLQQVRRMQSSLELLQMKRMQTAMLNLMQ